MSEDDHEEQVLASAGSRPRQPTARGGAPKDQRHVPLGGRTMAGGGTAFRRLGSKMAVAKIGAEPLNVDTPPEAPGVREASNVDTPPSQPDSIGPSNVDTPPRSGSVGTDASEAPTTGPGGAAGNADAFVYDELHGAPPKDKAARKTMRTAGNLGMLKPAQPDPDRFAELRRMNLERLRPKRADDAPTLGSVETRRTVATQQAYAERGKQLLKRFRRETDAVSDTQVDPMAFARWFLSRRPELSASSYRTYKQGVLAVLSTLEGQAAEDAYELIENAPRWDSQMDEPRKPAASEKPDGRVTNARKAKHLSYEDWYRLDAYLSHKAVSEYAQHLREWLRAGLATGLRPDEWMATQVVSNGLKTFLFVMNAKNTNGRANGEMRTLDITGFTARTMTAIRHMSDEGLRQAEAGTFEEFQKNVSQALYRADSALFTSRRTTTIALYTCRHQFILNMRAARKTDVEISALVGHMTTETATSHYGKRGKGWSPDKLVDVPDAVEQEMATVRQEIGFYERRREIENVLGQVRGVRAKRNYRSAEAEGGPEVSPPQAPEIPVGK